jgi:hypothetical protein
MEHDATKKEPKSMSEPFFMSATLPTSKLMISILSEQETDLVS